MATFVEIINEESEYTKLMNVCRDCFNDGDILNKQSLLREYMKYYSSKDIGAATKAVNDEFDRLMTNLKSYAKVKEVSRGNYERRLRKTSREERRHEQKEVSI